MGVVDAALTLLTCLRLTPTEADRQLMQLQARSWCILEFVYHSIVYRLVTVTWCPLSVWKAPLLSPGVASEAGHLTLTTQVNLGCPRSG